MESDKTSTIESSGSRNEKDQRGEAGARPENAECDPSRSDGEMLQLYEV